VSEREGYDWPSALAVDAAGDVFVVGMADAAVNSIGNNFVAKYSADGEQMWLERGDLDTISYAYGVALDPTDDSAIVVGTMQDKEGVLGDFYAYVAHYDAAGEQVSMRQVGTDGQATIDHIASDGAGNFIVAGDGLGPSADFEENAIFLGKMAPNGDLLWTVQRPGHPEDWISDITLDACGNLVATGLLVGLDDQGISSDLKALLVEYSPDGTLLWEQTLGGDEQKYSMAIASDGEASVFLAGWDYGASGDGFATTSFLTRYR